MRFFVVSIVAILAVACCVAAGPPVQAGDSGADELNTMTVILEVPQVAPSVRVTRTVQRTVLKSPAAQSRAVAVVTQNQGCDCEDCDCGTECRCRSRRQTATSKVVVTSDSQRARRTTVTRIRSTIRD